MTSTRPIDDEIQALCLAGRVDDATARVLKNYGAELMGLLVSLVREEATAADAYSLLCERIWKRLPEFRFESSVRTWAYVLTRRALVDAQRAQQRGPRQIGMSPSQLPEVVELARSSTRPHLRTTNKVKLEALRAELSDDDRMLLVLRIDRQLPWRAIARILGDDGPQDDESLKRTAAALRKRFERAKARLTATFLGR